MDECWVESPLFFSLHLWSHFHFHFIRFRVFRVNKTCKQRYSGGDTMPAALTLHDPWHAMLFKRRLQFIWWNKLNETTRNHSRTHWFSREWRSLSLLGPWLLRISFSVPFCCLQSDVSFDNHVEKSRMPLVVPATFPPLQNGRFKINIESLLEFQSAIYYYSSSVIKVEYLFLSYIQK